MSFDSRIQMTDTKFLEYLEDAELKETVRDFETETKRMEMENKIFEKFLRTYEPSLIASMEHTLEVVRKLNISHYLPQLTTQASIIGVPTSDSVSKISGFRSETQSALEVGASTGRPSERGPRINFSQKTDLVLREIEETQTSLKKFEAISHRRKCRLKAEIEESNIRAQEVKESKEDFEQVIVKGAVEKLTLKIPAEKFVRYMQEWMKTAQFMLEKLRLRTSSLRIQQAKLKNLLVQKIELGECVHEVDFEKLKIENKNFQIKVEQKNNHLLELKRINANANLMLTNHKKLLQRQDESLKNFKKSIRNTQKRILDLEEEDDLTQNEVLFEKERYKQLRKYVQLYKVPDVMEYIRKKAELDELQKTLKTWRRKSNIQKAALSTYTKMMIHVTGIRKPRISWYDMDRSKSNHDLTYDCVAIDENPGSETSLF